MHRSPIRASEKKSYLMSSFQGDLETQRHRERERERDRERERQIERQTTTATARQRLKDEESDERARERGMETAVAHGGLLSVCLSQRSTYSFQSLPHFCPSCLGGCCSLWTREPFCRDLTHTHTHAHTCTHTHTHTRLLLQWELPRGGKAVISVVLCCHLEASAATADNDRPDPSFSVVAERGSNPCANIWMCKQIRWCSCVYMHTRFFFSFPSINPQISMLMHSHADEHPLREYATWVAIDNDPLLAVRIGMEMAVLRYMSCSCLTHANRTVKHASKHVIEAYMSTVLSCQLFPPAVYGEGVVQWVRVFVVVVGSGFENPLSAPVYL